MSKRRDRRLAELGRRLGSETAVANHLRPQLMAFPLGGEFSFGLAHIPIAIQHGVWPPLALLLGAAFLVTCVVTAVTWPKRPSVGYQRILIAIAVVSFWPAVVFPPWLFFAGLMALFVAGAISQMNSFYRTAVESEELSQPKATPPPDSRRAAS